MGYLFLNFNTYLLCVWVRGQLIGAMSSLLLPCELQGSNSKAAGLTVSAFIGRVLSLAPKQGFERQGVHVLLNHLIDGAAML